MATRLMGVDHLARWVGEAGFEPLAGEHCVWLDLESYA
jgi:hypothetical protein